jgi:hypothetical protein
VCECQAGPRTVLTDCIISVHNRCLGLNIQSGVNQHSAYVPSHRGRLMSTKEPSRCIILCNSPPIYKVFHCWPLPTLALGLLRWWRRTRGCAVGHRWQGSPHTEEIILEEGPKLDKHAMMIEKDGVAIATEMGCRTFIQ